MKEVIDVEMLKEAFEEFLIDAEKFEGKGNKTAGRRSRVKSVAIAKMFKDWRKQSTS